MAPGQTLASLPVSGAESGLIVTLAPGTYYARVHALRAGVGSGPSNEVRIAVGLAGPPSAPRDVAALAIGTDVTVSWQTTFEGGAPDDLVLEVSGEVSGSLGLPPNGPITFAGVPPGIYQLSLRARNESGLSDATPPVTVAVPGATIAPLQRPALSAEAARLQVRYEDFTTPRLGQFVAREQLVAVVQDSASEFDALLKLKDWVAAQFPMGVPSPYPPWDAMTVLDWIRAGYTGGFCGQYSQVFLQALAAFGVPARYMEVGTTYNPYNHYTTEVWSNDYNKWVLLDVAFNNHFVRDGVPLSAWEVRDAMLRGAMHEVQVVLGNVRDGHPSPAEWQQGTAELHYYQRYHLKANHLSAPGEPPFERYLDMIEWLDQRTVPWEESAVPSEFAHDRPTLLETNDRTLIDWAPNQVWIAARRVGPLRYSLDLQHTVLQLSHFEYRVIDRQGVAGPWLTQHGSAIPWTITANDRVVEVRGVNVRGRRGPISSVQIVTP